MKINSDKIFTTVTTLLTANTPRSMSYTTFIAEVFYSKYIHWKNIVTRRSRGGHQSGRVENPSPTKPHKIFIQ